jgi:hypothetical protein
MNIGGGLVVGRRLSAATFISLADGRRPKADDY